MRIRYVLRPDEVTKQSIHFRGMPPELGGTGRQRMAPPVLLVIEQHPEGIYLIRYDASGSEVGDTWHASIEDAKEQASFEYEIDPERWEQDQTGE